MYTQNRRAALLAPLLSPHAPPLPEDAFLPQCDVAALGPFPLLRLLLGVDARATLALLAGAFQVGVWMLIDWFLEMFTCM